MNVCSYIRLCALSFSRFLCHIRCIFFHWAHARVIFRANIVTSCLKNKTKRNLYCCHDGYKGCLHGQLTRVCIRNHITEFAAYLSLPSLNVIYFQEKLGRLCTLGLNILSPATWIYFQLKIFLPRTLKFEEDGSFLGLDKAQLCFIIN